MICPKCGGKTRVDSTTNQHDNTVLRRRQCIECKLIFGTVECIIEDQEQFKHDWYIQRKERDIKKERRK